MISQELRQLIPVRLLESDRSSIVSSPLQDQLCYAYIVGLIRWQFPDQEVANILVP